MVVILLRNFANIFRIPELTRKLVFTLAVMFVFRVGTFIPVIGINVPALAEFMNKSLSGGGIFSFMDIFSGGALTQCTLFALGIGPYITASIMTQMLSMTIPSWEQLSKEGEFGRRIINQRTRYLALGLSVFYASAYAYYLEVQGLVLSPGLPFKLLFVLSLAVGAMFVMWLGEQISLNGLGNGSSMIIFAGIIARFPDYVARTLHHAKLGELQGISLLIILVIFLALVGIIVFLEKGERKIPVQYARRVIGQRMYGGQSTYIPFKINVVGVMPVIFAAAMLNVPAFLLSMLSGYFEMFGRLHAQFVPGSWLYNTLQFGLIVYFTFFYTALMFNPTELATQLKKNGGFVPGIRPGKRTSEFFDYLLNRIGLVGALYLGTLSILPSFLGLIYPVPFSLIGGTQLLILVGVTLEFASQVESYLIEHRYEGFLTTGRVKT